MFNFNTNKKQNEPNLNSAITGGNTNEAVASANPSNEYIDAQINEIEAQRMEFMKKKPDFDMKAELNNPKFVDYVWKNKLSIEDAYLLTHREEIISQEVNESIKRIMERKDRIVENGAAKNSPATVKKNPKDMSDKEIDAIITRVQNGEKISF